uniref:GDSL esterase/lipase n=2 Tax=Oryza brachyantha TaxID=4533 RepID=J3M2V2_ORYBR
MKKSGGGATSSGFRGVCLVMAVIIVLSIQAAAAAAVGGDGGGNQLQQLNLRASPVYVLGDSTLDVGNNNDLPGKDVFRANRPYYGVDYLPGFLRPTGRFSNGYNVADYISRKLGLAKSPPAYMSLVGPLNFTLVLSALTDGVSFASGGAGILDSTNVGQCIPLSAQMRNMEATRAAMAAKVGDRTVADLFSRSFFLLGVGNNDMFVFATANSNATPTQVAAFYSALAGNYSDAITGLYRMGARKFGVINVGLVGCVPLMRLQSPAGDCSRGLNSLAAGFNSALASLLAGLASRLPGFTYSLADSFGFAEEAFADPAASGYRSVDTACCGGGRLGAERECERGCSLCSDRDQVAFFDRIHPCQRACMLSANAYFDGPAQYTKPINFKQLASARSSSAPWATA